MPITIEPAARRDVSAPPARRDEAAVVLHGRLIETLAKFDDLAIAVSGGIDSMTLAFVAHRFLHKPPRMVHAVSPAVPVEATLRIRDYASREGWNLSLVDAGEFADPDYRANPVNRCYFCKSNLYTRIGGLSSGTIASGTNLDDLGDYRPGLKAAEERNVVHPFVEARIGKQEIRTLAHWYGLDDIAELPAQPCLASRVETGIAIDAGDLTFIDAAERHVRRHLPPQADVRCRLTQRGVVLEVGGQGAADLREIKALFISFCEAAGRTFLGVRPYRQGSAFLRADGRQDDHAH